MRSCTIHRSRRTAPTTHLAPPRPAPQLRSPAAKHTEQQRAVRSRVAQQEIVEHVFKPQSIHDISNGNILGFAEQLAEGHPGYHDAAYKQRRAALSRAAKLHRMCAPARLCMAQCSQPADPTASLSVSSSTQVDILRPSGRQCKFAFRPVLAAPKLRKCTPP